MNKRQNWRDAEQVAARLESRPSDWRAIALLSRLPLADVRVLEGLSGVKGATTVYRSLTRLRHEGLIASVTPPAACGSAPQRFYLTDLGLAALALKHDLEVTELARRYRIRASDLASLLPCLPYLAALYDMLGAVASVRDGQPLLLAWERPWHWHFQRARAKGPVSITFPAFAALSWDEETRTYLLLPDLGTFPSEVYRVALTRLLQFRRIDPRPLPPLLIATDAERGVATWCELLHGVARARFERPLTTRVFAWEDLRTGLQCVEQSEANCPAPSDHLVRSIRIQPLRVRQPTSPLPQLVGHALTIASRPARGNDQLALGLTPADYRLMNVVACHPFLSRDSLRTVLGWQGDAVRQCRNRLIGHGLVRLLEPGEVQEAAALQLVELTRAGLELVAAYRGVSLPVAVREIGLAGGGSHQPLGARAKLLRNLSHTLGADELFAGLYRVARRFVEAGGDDAVVEWQNATACSRRHLRPDGYGTYRRGGRHFGFFLEFDRGTMNRRDYFKKFSAYYEYATTRRFERDYIGFPTVLVVTTSNSAEERIAEVARSVAIGRSVALPLLLTCRWRVSDPTNPEGLLGRIWRTPADYFGKRRNWLPRVLSSHYTEPWDTSALSSNTHSSHTPSTSMPRESYRSTPCQKLF